MKGIAIVMMLLHHMYLSAERFKGYEVSFAPFPKQTVIYTCNFFKICVPIATKIIV